MAKEQKQSFVAGAAILSAGMLIVKILGLLFSVPLANIIDMNAMSYFYTAYDIFSVFLILSTAGLPIAVSRMVGTAYSQGRKKEADRVFFVAFWLFFAIGLVGALIMALFSQQIAILMSNEGASQAIVALAPTMFFISVMSALRGYFQGRSNMVPTAVSQIIEAVTKVIIGVGLAMYILNTIGSDQLAATGAIIGVSISAGLGTIYLLLYMLRQSRMDKKLRKNQVEVKSEQGTKFILKSLLVFAIPITLGSCFLAFLDVVDSAIVMNRLQSAAGFSLEVSETLRTALGNARKYFDLPGAFVVPISTALLPVLSAAIANKNKNRTKEIAAISMRITFLISIPSSVGMVIFAEPICNLLLFANPESAAKTAPLLAAMGIAIMFNSTLFTTNAILQSFGKTVLPVVNMGIGGIVKVALTYILVGIPVINVMGSSISTVISYALIMILNILAVNKSVPSWGGFFKTSLPPIAASLAMGGISYLAYYGLSMVTSSIFTIIPVILIAIVVYGLCAVKFKAVKYADVAMLPKGATIAKILRLRPDGKDIGEEMVELNESALEEMPVNDFALENDISIEKEIVAPRRNTGDKKSKPKHFRK